jgi:hypothetical protein
VRPDRNKIVDIFSSEEEIVTPTKRHTSRKKQPEKPTVMQSQKERFLHKLKEEEFSAFDHKDWFQYFVHKAQGQGIRYLTRNYAKEYAIIKSIMNELPWTDLKNMIDFVFDSNQDIVDKRTVGLWILSKGWINTVFQSTQLWLDGDYKPKTAPKHNREWKAEASRKSSGTGLHYGKPIKDDEDDEIGKPKRKIKRKKKPSGDITIHF